MPKITIDGVSLNVPEGTTVLQAAQKAGINIPTLCYMQGHQPLNSCMVCLVRVNGAKKLSPSCGLVVSDGMVVESETEEIIHARKTALELLLGDHRGDCVGPCQDVCPAHMDIPLMISLLSQNKVEEAIEVIKERIALPAVLGRICVEICEKGCRRGHIDSPVSICRLKRFAADVDLASKTPYIPKNAPSTGKSVAVVGSGPAGLSASYYLARAGHVVYLYDSCDAAGGSLRNSSLSDKLPAEVLDAEINVLLMSGITFRGGSNIEPLDDLLKKYDAVVLCVGNSTAELSEQWGLKHTGKGIYVDTASGMTSRHGVFAAGSCVAPTKHAVRACAQGRHAALAVSAFLSGDSVMIDERPYGVRMGHLLAGELEALSGSYSKEPRVTDSGRGLTEAEVQIETKRCLHCECAKVNDCRLRDTPKMLLANPLAYKAEHRKYTRNTAHPQIVYEPSKCISCGLCVQITEERAEKLGLAFKDRGFNVEIGVPFNSTLPDGLQDVAIECARACPTAALHVSEKGGE